jgi:hypothetical protein
LLFTWASSGLDAIWLWFQFWIVWMQFGFGFNSELFAQLTKFLIFNACLKNLQVVWNMDCLTWRWANLLRLGEIWVRFYSIFQLWQSTKLIPPTAELIFYSPIWICMEPR